MPDDSPSPIRSPELLDVSRSRLLLIDLQERLVPVMHEQERLIDRCRLLTRGAVTLGVPCLLTEQYPHGLGSTIETIRETLPTDVTPVEKLRFSGAEAIVERSSADAERDQVVIAGIEAHVCVQQTVLDLLACGYRVHVVLDAVTSRSPFDAQTARDRMRDAGAVVTTVEAVLFEWCEAAGTDTFKKMSRLVTGRE